MSLPQGLQMTCCWWHANLCVPNCFGNITKQTCIPKTWCFYFLWINNNCLVLGRFQHAAFIQKRKNPSTPSIQMAAKKQQHFHPTTETLINKIKQAKWSTHKRKEGRKWEKIRIWKSVSQTSQPMWALPPASVYSFCSFTILITVVEKINTWLVSKNQNFVTTATHREYINLILNSTCCQLAAGPHWRCLLYYL